MDSLHCCDLTGTRHLSESGMGHLIVTDRRHISVTGIKIY